MTVRRPAEEIDDVERCRQARRALERRYKTLDGLCAHFMRLQRKRSANIGLMNDPG